jgi:thymidylate kinase
VTRTRGKVLSVVGPDGTGKTSLCDALVDELLSGRRVLRVHHRFGLLPGRARHDGPVREPHRKPPYGRLLSEAKVLWLFVDFVLGWTRRARPFVRGGGWVVLERGWWDLVVDPRRYRLHPRTRAAAWLGGLLPQPDLLFVLEGPADVLLARKPELPADELRRQMAAWHDIVPSRVTGIFLDTSRAFDDVLLDAGREVVAIA